MLEKELQKLITPIITTLGYELIGVEHLSKGGHKVLLRIYIDHPQGIKLSDCERVSHQVSGVLDVQDLTYDHYTLEISSPGLNRPLFTLDHFKRFIGNKVKVRLTRPLNTQRNFTGILQRIQDCNVIVMANETEYSLPYEQIEKAHLMPDEKPHI
ncbi:ribosome maturation factor RimP [Candidatus Parabeggiatoa sp. HSG14]|uniref:ribosome maturation factor RimP n=1 Tax=Candidatus Parabeggiatoa sp. HSG14 TaxID=3055593 RepID=UPI0025A81E09|nr:ribosome maturation factor RimP [Thiotrichales bacterium HSG14]